MQGKWGVVRCKPDQYYFWVDGYRQWQFKALYREINNELMLEELTNGSAPWTRNSNQEVISFLRTRLKEATKVWFYFVSSKLVPFKLLFTVGRDKALLSYAIVKGINSTWER